jgi:hypothetical protein
MSTPVNGMSLQPWDRQERESLAAFRAFTIYRDLGLERTLAAACRTHAESRNRSKSGPKTVRRDPRNSDWRKWFTMHRWEERARAWDRHNAAVAQKALDEQTARDAVDWARRRTEAIERQYRAAEKLVRKTEAIVESLPDNLSVDTKQMRDAAAVLNTATALIHDAIDTALPDDDMDFDPHSATTEELQAFLARMERKRQSRLVSREAP